MNVRAPPHVRLQVALLPTWLVDFVALAECHLGWIGHIGAGLGASVGVVLQSNWVGGPS